MKLPIITDTHAGVRGDHPAFMDNYKKFLDETFFPVVDLLGCKDIVHAGDVLDRRKFINFYTASRLRTDFFEECWKRNVRVHYVPGNHDLFYKSTNSLNGLKELYHSVSEDKLKFYDEPEEVAFGKTKILFLPWISQENSERVMRAVSSSRAPALIGHLELKGFQMYKGTVCEEGLDPTIFDKFQLVMSGHFHQRSTVGNVTYLGSPGEFTWADAGESRGFNVLDTSSLALEHFSNPHVMFEKVYYDDSMKLLEASETNVEGKIVKVIVKNKTNPFAFDEYVKSLERQDPVSLTVVEDHLNSDSLPENEISTEAQDTRTVFTEYVDRVVDDEKKKLMINEFLCKIYDEAMEITS